MTGWLDISLPLRNGMVIWPNSSGFQLRRSLSLEAGDAANVSRLDCDVHVGTHVDAPRHFLADGAPVDEISLETLIGPAMVAKTAAGPVVTPEDLAELGLPSGTERLLLRTRNSLLWEGGTAQFNPDFTGLSAGAARWLVDRGVRLIGVDYLSVERMEDAPAAHRILLQAGVVILEGLDLSHVEPGRYELICLPLRLVGAEGAPARAVLRPLPIPGPGGAN